MTGSNLRTARTLNQSQTEFLAGLAGRVFGGVSQVVIRAYGIADRLETNGRY